MLPRLLSAQPASHRTTSLRRLVRSATNGSIARLGGCRLNPAEATEQCQREDGRLVQILSVDQTGQKVHPYREVRDCHCRTDQRTRGAHAKAVDCITRESYAMGGELVIAAEFPDGALISLLD